jgi:hypothetical protein
MYRWARKRLRDRLRGQKKHLILPAREPPVWLQRGEGNEGLKLRTPRIVLIAALLSGMLPLLSPSVQHAGAATLTVTRTGDPNPNGCHPNDCSLREAVIASNNRPGPDVIKLGPHRYELTRPMPDEDASQSGDLDIAKNVTIDGAGRGRTIIDGNRNDRIFHIFSNVDDAKVSDLAVKRGSRTVDEAQEHGGGGILNLGKLRLANVLVENNRILIDGYGGGISNQGRLIVSNSRITGNRTPDEGVGGGIDNTTGRLVLRKSRVDHNELAIGDGAGIYMNSGTALIDKSTVDHNETSGTGGGFFATAASELEAVDSSFKFNLATACCGGGLAFEDSEARIRQSVIKRNRVEACCSGGVHVSGTSDVVLRGTLISDNRVVGFAGGGVLVQDNSTSKVINSRVRDNKVNGGNGGGLQVSGSGKLTVVGTLVKGNEAAFTGGGGINTIAAGLSLVVENSTIVGNLSSTDGGGIRVASAASAEITNSTISGNTSGDEGGGILDVTSGTVALTHVTITKNDAASGGDGILTDGGTWSILRSIVANNTDDDCNAILTGPTGKNLDKDSSCFNNAGALHAAPRLRPLGNYGGATPTHPPKLSSPAVDAVGASACPPPARDQRGVRRPKNGDGEPGSTCDLGAVERKP